MKILLTSGGTKVSIDCVRSITNMSRGTFGSAICKEFLLRGHEVDFLMAKDSRTPFEFRYHAFDCVQFQKEVDSYRKFVEENNSRYREHVYKTFEEYYAQVMTLLDKNKYDMVILAAAVSDYGIESWVNGKIRSKEDLNIELSPLPKIIGKIKELQPYTFLVGFKLLVGSTEDELMEAANDSLNKNKCGIVVANDLEDIKCDNHTLLIVEKDKITRIEKKTCEEGNTTLPRELVNHIMVSYVTPKSDSFV